MEVCCSSYSCNLALHGWECSLGENSNSIFTCYNWCTKLLIDGRGTGEKEKRPSLNQQTSKHSPVIKALCIGFVSPYKLKHTSSKFYSAKSKLMHDISSRAGTHHVWFSQKGTLLLSSSFDFTHLRFVNNSASLLTLMSASPGEGRTWRHPMHHPPQSNRMLILLLVRSLSTIPGLLKKLLQRRFYLGVRGGGGGAKGSPSLWMCMNRKFTVYKSTGTHGHRQTKLASPHGNN